LTLLSLLAVASASHVPTLKTTAASWATDNLPEGWTIRGRAQPDRLLEFTIAVRLKNVGVLEKELMAVSDPLSARYGQHLSSSEASTLTAPEPGTLNEVLGFLSESGINGAHASASGAFVSFHATVAQAEKLLQATYFELEDKAGRRATRTPSFQLPLSVHAAVDAFEPTLRLPTVSVAAVASRLSKHKTTPTTLRGLYGVDSVEGKQGSGNKQATANFLGQFYSKTDLSAFFQELYPVADGRNVAQQIGPNNVSKPGVEAELDIQYLMAMGGGVETWFWSTTGQVGENEPFLKWLSDLASAKDVPALFSISYADYEDTVDYSYAARVSQEFMRAGVRGITLISGSGDGGVEGAQPRKCPGGRYVPTFPCASPYETCVGGTTGAYGAGQTESAVSFSGGGFANYFPAPSFQKGSISSWRATAAASGNLPQSGLFNSTGRGFPDVAAMGTDFQVFVNGKAVSVGGTSASTPTFAGIASLLNDLRFQKGEPPLGFLNPLLYQNPEAFHDIVSGSNPGCGGKGFYAEQGWDPITGLGTPDYTKLASIVAALPSRKVLV